MFVITVIPIVRAITKESLTYFTSVDIEVGSLVEIPVRKKIVQGLVIKKQDAKDARNLIRSVDFVLKKIDKLVSKPFLSKEYIETAEEVARFHAATLGATLNVMGLPKITSSNSFQLQRSNKNYKDSHCNTRIEGSLQERLEKIKKITKTPIVKAVIITPTREKQKIFKEHFEIPVLTPGNIVEIDTDTTHIFLEDYNSNSYKSIRRPFIDFRVALKKYGEKIGATVIDCFPILDKEIEKVVDHHKKEELETFSSIGKNLSKDLLSIKQSPKKIFILSSRKGHSGSIICADCSTIIFCKKCSAPLAMHLKKNKEGFNNLLCHHCGHLETALRKCDNCGSWKLRGYGLGIEKVEEDIKNFIKKHKIAAYVQRIDSTLKMSPVKIRDFIKTHEQKPSSILIGTEMVLPYLKKINYASYVASIDTLFSLPDFSIDQKIWRLFQTLDEVSIKKVIVQTKNPSHQILTFWREDDEKTFWKNEKESRERFSYPPYGVLIKITAKGKKEKITAEMKSIENKITKWKPNIFPAFIKTVNNNYILHAMITLSNDKWVDNDLLEILLSLPPNVEIEVNPNSLL